MIQTMRAGQAGGGLDLGVAPPGGLVNIHDNSAAVSTVVTTTLPHGLITGDHVFFASSDSNALINGDRHIVRVDDTSFTLLAAVDCQAGAGTNATTMEYAIIANTKAAASVVTSGSPHGLRTGDTVTIANSNCSVPIDGTHAVTVLTTRTFSVPVDTTLAVAAGTEGNFTKVVYYLELVNRGDAAKGGAVVITSTIGEAPTTVTVNIQGSFDRSSWFNVPYSLVATPRTFVITALTIVTAVSTTYILQEDVPYRYLRLACSAATNVALSATAYIVE
jgi:hypothetical protein